MSVGLTESLLWAQHVGNFAHLTLVPKLQVEHSEKIRSKRLMKKKILIAKPTTGLALTLAALDGEHYEALPNVWMKNFMLLPLTHCEGKNHLKRIDRGIELADQLLEIAPEHLRPVYEFCAAQPREHRKVVAAFGRHPHRNAVLGRSSTPDELAYLAEGAFPHQREVQW